MRRTRQKIFFAFLLGMFSLLLLVPLVMPTAHTPRNDLWPEIARHIDMDYKVGQNPEVDNQIRWYLQHPKTLQALFTNAQPYLYYVYQQIRERHLPAELALIPIIESSYNPFAESTMGATGLWQMMPATAADYGIKTTASFDGRLDVPSSTQAALDHFASLHAYFGDWLLAIAAYDAGAGTVKAIITQNQALHQATDVWSLSLPDEAKFYVTKFIALATIIKDPHRFHISLPAIANEPFFSMFPLSQTVNLNQVAKTTQTDMNTLRRLNPGLNPQTNIVHKGDYALLIPKDKAPLLEKSSNLVATSNT